MLTRTEGVVLKSTVFGEADLIVTYLTRDFGILKAFAKSPRKTKSRFGSSLEPLTYARIAVMGRENANLPRLTQSDIVRPFQRLREDYGIFVRTAGLIELNLRFLPEREPNPEAFRLLVQTLSRLESGVQSLYFLYAKTRFLQICGYLPELAMCGRCGHETVSHGTHDFYLAHGAILCVHCSSVQEEARQVSAGAVRVFRSMLNWRFATLDRFSVADGLINELDNLLEAHIAYVLARPLRARAAVV
ncbi:MAG TPA: DNA repair protein RecO [Dissulfurispiraceae bacterium]|nr:DNA repair protein RecO [Dissulfurispiraceae bacterium]